VLDSEEIDGYWQFDDPKESERRFRALLPDYPERKDEILTQVARALGLQGRYDEAQEILDSIDIGPATPPIIAVRHALEVGRVLNSSGNPKEAEPCFHRALDLARANGLEFYAVDAAHMLGIVAEGDEALEWNLRTIAMIESSQDPRTRRWLGSLLNNTGWSLHDAGRYEEAHDFFLRALHFREQIGEPGPIRIARWCVARALRSLKRYEKAMEILLDLDASSEPDGYVHEELAECLLALGRTMEAQAEFARAYELLSADAWLVEREPERLERLARIGAGGEP
jgi:tetratricopeptide (TPR) repeat protein